MSVYKGELVNDLEKIGKGISTLHESYDEAMKKLQTGSGNLIGRVENIRKLGVKTSKNMPEKFNADGGENLLNEEGE